jgi:tryptophanyl-tRNA synthetase
MSLWRQSLTNAIDIMPTSIVPLAADVQSQQSKVDEDLMMQVMQQAERHQTQAAKIQQKLNQRSMEAALKQQEAQRLQQKLADAEDRARRAEDSAAAIRWDIKNSSPKPLKVTLLLLLSAA